MQPRSQLLWSLQLLRHSYRHDIKLDTFVDGDEECQQFAADGQLLGTRRGEGVGRRRRRELTAAAAGAEPRAVQLAAEEMLLD